ncbi:MAG: dienelactone hydrolase family protein [Acidobacteriales bacterium]|nr:dienelactone hydrolase family protein [Terriglobales bacterium]
MQGIWRMLSRALAAVALAAFLVAPLAAAPSAETQKVTHYQSKDKKIGIVIYQPHKPGKYPAIVVLHGSNGPVSDFVGGYAQQLADQGYVLAMIHYFDATGTKPYPSYAQMEHSFPDWEQAVRDGISFLDQNPYVDRGQFGLLGVSLGGFLSTSVSSVDPRIKCVVNVSGGIPESVAKAAKRMAPTLILHGDADNTVPVRQAFELESVLKRTGTPYEIEIYPGQGHMFRGEAQFDAMTRSLGFLDEHLRMSVAKQ